MNEMRKMSMSSIHQSVKKSRSEKFPYFFWHLPNLKKPLFLFLCVFCNVGTIRSFFSIFQTRWRICYLLALSIIAVCVFHSEALGCVGLYCDVSKVGNVKKPGRHFDKRVKMSAWLNFQPNRTMGRPGASPFCVT